MNQGPPDPYAPESQPTRQGRRLIQMLFRSGVDDLKTLNRESIEHDNRAEDAQPPNPQESVDNHAPPPVPTSKFASLKRKLFPSQNRRYPRHVPPLSISPINAPVKPARPPLGDNNLNSITCKSLISQESEADPINNCSSNAGLLQLRQPQCSSYEDAPEHDFPVEEGDNNWKPIGGRTLIDEDDDLDLESAVEALDLETSAVDKTLEEMNKAIDDLRTWKETYQQETQKALDKMLAEEELDLRGAKQFEDANRYEDHLEAQLEFKIQRQQQHREAQTLELRKEAEAYQLECNLFRMTLDESDAIRVDQVLQDNSDSEGLALSRLRNELFRLDVKQRQEALLLELEGADNALDMNIVDVQAFTGELDAILAQFDKINTNCDLKVEDENLII